VYFIPHILIPLLQSVIINRYDRSEYHSPRVEKIRHSTRMGMLLYIVLHYIPKMNENQVYIFDKFIKHQTIPSIYLVDVLWRPCREIQYPTPECNNNRISYCTLVLDTENYCNRKS